MALLSIKCQFLTQSWAIFFSLALSLSPPKVQTVKHVTSHFVWPLYIFHNICQSADPNWSKFLPLLFSGVSLMGNGSHYWVVSIVVLAPALRDTLAQRRFMHNGHTTQPVKIYQNLSTACLMPQLLQTTLHCINVSLNVSSD